jgi:hypothetical protein
MHPAYVKVLQRSEMRLQSEVETASSARSQTLLVCSYSFGLRAMSVASRMIFSASTLRLRYAAGIASEVFLLRSHPAASPP